MKQFLLFMVVAFPMLVLAQPTLTFTPANGATTVSLTNDLTISASEGLKHIGGGTIDNASIDGLITLTNAAMTPFPFDASIDAPKRDITINITGSFQESTTYILTFNPVENGTGQATTTKVITFT